MIFIGRAHRTSLRFSHRFVARRVRRAWIQGAEGQRAEAYLNSMSSTVNERNEVDAVLSRAAAEKCEKCRLTPLAQTAHVGSQECAGNRDSIDGKQRSTVSEAQDWPWISV